MTRTIRAQISAAALFWGAVFLVQNLNWGAGAAKALVLLALLFGALYLALREVKPLQAAAEKPPRALAALALFLLLAQLVYFGLRIGHPHLIDMATTTLDAGKAMLQGQNPYTMPIDTEAAGLGVLPEFQGYKYLPLMPAVYLPLGLAFGARGLLATNLLLLSATLGLMQRLGRDAAGPRAGLIAVLLYLSIPLAAQQVLVKGSTDLASVAPLLLGFLFWNAARAGPDFAWACRFRPSSSPACCSCPASCPAAGRRGGVMPSVPRWGCCRYCPTLGSRPRRFTTTSCCSTPSARPTAPAGWHRPRTRFSPRARSSSRCSREPRSISGRRAPGLATRAGLGAMLVLGAILAGPAAHHNYHLWWLPFYCVALAAAL